MSGLTPVAFDRRPAPAPRISEPYVPGKHDRRFWTEAENEILRANYSTGGGVACLSKLPDYRTLTSVYAQANKLGLRAEGMTTERKRHRFTPEMDAQIREEWARLDGNKRGEVGELADRLGLPRWVLSKRAAVLGLTVTHRKEPSWTAAEDLLMTKVPLAHPERAAKIFREHGFSRTATAITVRAKRLNLSRRTSRETLSATGAAKILGIDVKGVTALCISGILPATKREDRRSPQQGGSAWDIKPGDLRQYIVDQVASIDLRKVDKVAFVDLLVGQDEASKLAASA